MQSEPEEQDKNQISEKKFQNFWDFELKFSNVSDFETKFSQLVRFCFKNFTTRQILDWKEIQRVRFWTEKIYDASDFEENFFFKTQFFKKPLHTRNHVLIQFTP